MAGELRRVYRVTLTVAAAIAFIMAIGVWTMWYRPEMLSGDGTMTDNGIWSYPQYTVSFPHLEIVNGAHAILHVKGLPRAPMVLSLRAVTPDRSNALAAVDLTGDWVFIIRIRDDQGQEIYDVSDPLSEWHMQQSGASASLWHESLRDLSFSPNREYVIEIQVSGSQTPSGVFLEPQLAGGGNELP